MVIITISVTLKLWLSLFRNLDQKNRSHHASVKGYLFALAWCEGFFFGQNYKKEIAKI